MRHCVATYIYDCRRRRTSIWSLKLNQGEHRNRLLTIEVDPKTRTIWHARGRRNSPPTEKSQELLRYRKAINGDGRLQMRRPSGSGRMEPLECSK